MSYGCGHLYFDARCVHCWQQQYHKRVSELQAEIAKLKEKHEDQTP